MDVLNYKPMRILFLLLLFINFLYAKEFRKPEEVLKELFPDAKIEIKNLIIPKEKVKEIEKKSRVKIRSRLVSFYLIKKNGKVIAYAYVDIHRVRTHPEAVLYVISPQGKITYIEILAFHEPLEYMPPENWLKLFIGKDVKSPPKFRRDIPNITGATLTARAIAKHTRKVLYMWQAFFGGKE